MIVGSLQTIKATFAPLEHDSLLKAKGMHQSFLDASPAQEAPDVCKAYSDSALFEKLVVTVSVGGISHAISCRVSLQVVPLLTTVKATVTQPLPTPCSFVTDWQLPLD